MYQQPLHYVYEGFLDHRSQLPNECRAFWNVREKLSVDDGLVVYGCRLVIQSTLQKWSTCLPPRARLYKAEG